MRGQEEIQIIMNSFTTRCKELFGHRLLEVRLYGSYARGDQEEYSDIDLLVLIDTDGIEARKYLSPVCGIASDISLEHNGIDLSPFICGKDQYDKLKSFPGFYNSIFNEGISVYAG